MKDQLFQLLKKLLVHNNIQINQEELLVQLSSHPSYPSLHSVIGVLDHFNIPNIAVRLSKEIEILKELPKSFLAVVEKNTESEIILVNKTKDSFKTVGINGEKTTKSSSEFLKIWNGIVIAIEKDENVVETKKSFASKLVAFTPYLLGVGILGFFIIQANLFANFHFLLSAIGLFLSILLVRQDLGILSKAANSFCNFSEKTSCDAILQSKGATLFRILKLSDISLIAFLGYSITWLIYMSQGISDYSVIIALTMLALPFVAYSLHYQGAVLKKWCPLCLGVAAVLTLQAFALFSIEVSSVEFSGNTILVVIPFMAILISLIVWMPLKNLIQKNKTLKAVEIDHLKFKNNFKIFNVLLAQGTPLKTDKDIPSEIILGNPAAPLTLTLVTSPFCHYCKQAHKDISQLLARAGDKIKIRIRFRVSSKEQDTDLYAIVQQLLNTYANKGAKETKQLLHSLYEDTVDLKKWIENEVTTSNEKYPVTMDAQNNWCDENNVNFTPAFFIGNKPFPTEYSRLDLLNFIDELIEESNKTESHTVVNKKLAS